ncbi:sulfite exporter TauE/SafE family protein [Pelagicoccus sp. SDUM812003]|uniref:sulfite exporter TauE/SafE family protein n=1 Tax=Pelagicoccus sp. SDUM812003 TaxID=3041267 RepID=UPI0028100216|nr:sulfite exporter TauE/SafE family protein [Pelagicoccus sp. SDUM812003]MDQ8203617.1 sulfite exporter TauE/SafE family protein [Pelagicoccus sp. SDUM812003]
MGEEGNLYALLNPAAAFVAGAVASLHCVGMCGPLSCALIGERNGVRAMGSHGVYHAGRLISYSLLGLVAGGLGAGVVGWVGTNPARLAPWALMAFFLALAFGLDGVVTRWQAKKGYGRKWVQRAYRLSGYQRGFSLGLATPLIPCGPLYLMLWATTLSGSYQNGLLVMASFSLGTMPLLLLAQSGWSWLSTRLTPSRLSYLRRGLALVAVGLLCMRAFMDTGVDALLSEDALCR